MSEARTALWVAVDEALRAYAEPTRQCSHMGAPDAHCQAHDEGQWCCIDHNHEGYAPLVDCIVAAVLRHGEDQKR